MERESEEKSEWERVEEIHGESGRERERREGVRKEGWEGEGNSSYQIIQTGQAFCGRFTNRTQL